ncbi:MAG: hypothetical protein CVU14_05950 [Bacteroidetes bacterium HGW-Bacteroidetes-9]|nr:MAG: hypothetical protein CVU14_05950 [Bacteroidetes bacterium HGW-Bacteroidetes-9]
MRQINRLLKTRCMLITCMFFMGLMPLTAQYNYFDLPLGKDKSRISFENFDNIIIVTTVINDSIPVRLILDSGVEGVIITDMDVAGFFADRCLRNFRITAPGTIEILEACITSPVKIKFRGLQPAFTNLIMLKEDYFSLESYIGTKVHGLIGIEKFKNLMVTTNYDKNQVTFERPSTYKIPNRAEVIPIIISHGKPYMNSRIELDNGTIMDLWLLIDSGANHPLLIENETIDNYQPQKSVEAIIGKGLAGNMKGRFARAGWLMLGNYRLDNVITSFTDAYLPEGNDRKLDRNGTLGSGALSRFKVTFDYSRERMILKKGSKFRKPFEYNMSGMTVRSKGDMFNVFEVSDIISGSPADIAGILPGDILVGLDDHLTFGMTLGDINQKLSTKEGTKLNLLISRNGTTLSFKIKLKRLI